MNIPHFVTNLVQFIYIYMYKMPVVLREKECMLLDSNKGTVSL